MKSRANAAAAVAALLLCCFARSLGGTAIAHEHGEILANASMTDSAIREIFDDLVKESDVSTFVESSASEYFSQLDANFGNNMFGSCGFVAAGMLLSFYNQDVDNGLISDEYTVYSSGSSGTLFEPSSFYSGLTPSGYLDRILADGPASFQEELISTYEREVGAVKLDSGGISGLSSDDIGALIEAYLSGRDGISGEYSVSVDDGSADIRNVVIEDILSGTPSILIVSDPSSGDAHAVIAYDYDYVEDEIYVHTGWRDEETGESLTHVSLSSIGYSILNSRVSIAEVPGGGTSPIDYDVVIAPEDYGYADAYPTDDYTRYKFRYHIVDDFYFRTRRYRAGYIQSEYIVMSPIREDINEAFVEYNFDTAVTALEVDMSYWRETSHEWLDSKNGSAVFQIFTGNDWVTQRNLLSSTSALPTDRNNPKTYQFRFSRPIYRVRFYCEYWGDEVSDSNRGRICIGDMRLQLSEYSLPVSTWELDYEPDRWNAEDVKGKNNCYSYAMNILWKEDGVGLYPGFTTGLRPEETGATGSSERLEMLVMQDVENFRTIIRPSGKEEDAGEGFYKIAIALDGRRDYHFYRQNPDGTWSHKLGNAGEVENVDASGNIIYDPETCDRNYIPPPNSGVTAPFENGRDYRTFVGFYDISMLNRFWEAYE